MPSSGPGGVGDASFKPTEKTSSPLEELKENAGDMKVRTVGDIKKLLVSKLGKKKGMKLFNMFIASMAEMAMMTTQHAAEQAKQAAKQMRSGQ